MGDGTTTNEKKTNQKIAIKNTTHKKKTTKNTTTQNTITKKKTTKNKTSKKLMDKTTAVQQTTSENTENPNITKTPYDDVFRTLLNDCSSLIIPVINEVFEEHYSGKEEIIFSPNEHFLNQQDGIMAKRVTDTCFEIQGKERKKYHLECQSTADNSMLVRFFEYDTQIALDQGEMEENLLIVTFPHSAVLFLRSNASTPDRLKTRMVTPGGTIEYDIRVMKAQHYALEKIFEKNLLLLIPFYIFRHENQFEHYEKDDRKQKTLLEEYVKIKNELEELQKQEIISAYTRSTMIDMSNKVLENIAQNYDSVRKGVREVMGGKVLEYEAKTILEEGIQKGMKEGIKEGENRVNQLHSRLIAEERFDDLTRAVNDPAYQQQLFQEYKL